MDGLFGTPGAALSEALAGQDYEAALRHCLTMLKTVNDPALARLARQLSNIVKDGKIQENIRAFQGSHAGMDIPRERKFYPEIIIPCYNQGRFLPSALAYLPPQVPVTVINDASTDDTGEYISRLQGKCAFKILVNAANINQAGSINRAITESDNNLFIVLNADDVLTRYAFRAVVAVLENYDTVRLVGGGSIPFDDPALLAKNAAFPEQLPYLPQPAIFQPGDAYNFTAPNDINMTMSGCAFLRSAWQAAGGFWDFARRVCSFDDRDFQMRVCALFPVAVLPEPLAFYRVNGSVGRGRCI